MSLENLVGRGLQREPASREELSRFLARIETKLADAQASVVSMESRFDIAYEALLQIGIAALRANDMRPDSRGGHHVIALQTLPTTIGAPKTKIRLLDEFRRQRAAGLYDGSFLPTERELEELVSTVGELLALLREWIRTNRPEYTD
jgi:hypothetical protein